MSAAIAIGARSGTTITNVQILTDQGTPFTQEDLAEIDFGAIGLKEIMQNVKTILLTPLYSVPLDRLFGMDYSFLDMPMPVAQNMIMAEVLQRIGTYEPRCQTESVDWTGDALDGHLVPIVKINLLPSTYGDYAPVNARSKMFTFALPNR